jgi:hypothetical protein
MGGVVRFRAALRRSATLDYNKPQNEPGVKMISGV